MFYVFDKETLQLKKVSWVSLGAKLLTAFIVLSLVVGWTVTPKQRDYSETEIMLIMAKQNQFNPEKFESEIRKLNFKFPHIVYAQAVLETGGFQSKMFVENHNLFGMKEANKRINTARGTQNEHAYYDNWEKSLIDYALYSATYLYSIDNEDDYLNYLGQYYAEDRDYVNKIKDVIVKEKLKEKFN